MIVTIASLAVMIGTTIIAVRQNRIEARKEANRDRANRTGRNHLAGHHKVFISTDRGYDPIRKVHWTREDKLELGDY